MTMSGDTRQPMSFVIPTDGEWHQVRGDGPGLHASAPSEYAVRVWIEIFPGGAACEVRAFRDGAAVEGFHVASATTPNGVAWHLYRR